MACQNCGSNLQENFCAHCGEKKFDEHELTVKHFLSETLESFFHFDNRFLRSVKKLLLKPGQMALDFTEGKRVRFMKPLQLFLILNISLFFVPGNPFALSLNNYVTYKPFINYNTRAIVAEEIKKNHISPAAYTNRFDEKIKSVSKEFIFLYIPFYAFVFFLLFVYKKRKLAGHLVFACHFMGFYILLSIFYSFFVEMPFYFLAKTNYSQLFDNISTFSVQAFILIYLFVAMRKFYKASVTWSFISAASVAVSFFIFIQYYRMLLFFIITRFE